jgi:hypothetical protein
LSIPKPGLAALSDAFKQFQATRIAGDAKIDVDDTPLTSKSRGTSGVTTGAGTSPEEQAIEAWAEEGDKKVEVVLFLDCWMSTLETAFEISDSTARMIASQSLLPVGRHYANFVWPYDELLTFLLSPSFAQDMTNRLVQFYVDHFNEVQFLETIPVALLDLSAVPALSPAVATLVTKLSSLPDAEQRMLIEPARIVRLDTSNSYDPIILAGDSALIDIPTLCTTLRAATWPAGGSPQQQQDAQTAVAALTTALNALITSHDEAHAAGDSDIGFFGASAFHWPPIDLTIDQYITQAVRQSVPAYKSLKLVKQTQWEKLGLKNKI